MDTPKITLADYDDLIEATFPSAHMKPDVREAAILNFKNYVRTERLTTEEAVAVLKDDKAIQGFTQAIDNEISSAIGTDKQQQKPEVSITDALVDLQKDIGFLKNTVIDFTDFSNDTKEFVLGIGRSVEEINASVTQSNNTLDGIKAAADQLKENHSEALGKINVVVEKLEAIPLRFDHQVKKLEGLEKGLEKAVAKVGEAKDGIDEVKGYTHPDKTHDENVRMMWKSVFWSTLAGSICGTALGFLVTHLTTKEAPPATTTVTRIETKTVEKETCPATSWTLKDKTGKRVYTLEAEPTQGQTQAAPASQPKTITPAKKKIKLSGSTPR